MPRVSFYCVFNCIESDCKHNKFERTACRYDPKCTNSKCSFTHRSKIPCPYNAIGACIFNSKCKWLHEEEKKEFESECRFRPVLLGSKVKIEFIIPHKGNGFTSLYGTFPINDFKGKEQQLEQSFATSGVTGRMRIYDDISGLRGEFQPLFNVKVSLKVQDVYFESEECFIESSSVSKFYS